MIAIDTSSLRRYLERAFGRDTVAVDRAVERGEAILPPVVLTEALSEPTLDDSVIELTKSLPLLETDHEYRYRTGLLRAGLRRRGFKAQTTDCLIAQSCIDNNVPLITYDRDFRRFIAAGLKLAIEEV